MDSNPIDWYDSVGDSVGFIDLVERWANMAELRAGGPLRNLRKEVAPPPLLMGNEGGAHSAPTPEGG